MMSESDKHIDKIFSDKLGKGSLKGNTRDEWKHISRKISWNNFFSFNFRTFNFVYMTTGMVAIGISGFYMLANNNTGTNKTSVNKEIILEKEQDCLQNNEITEPKHQKKVIRPERKNKNNNCNLTRDNKIQKNNQSSDKAPRQKMRKRKHEEKKCTSNIDSLNKKIYFSDSVKGKERDKGIISKKTIGKIESGEKEKADKTNDVVLKLKQDTIVNCDTTKRKRKKLRFKWKK